MMSHLNFEVDKSKCIKCGLCSKDCIAKIIAKDSENFPFIKPGKEHYCIKCQHCFTICPKGAISIMDKNPEDSIASKNYVNPDDLLHLIQTRRSCRNYKKENLPQETIEKLKNVLNWIPTGINYKGLHFSFVEDINVMDEIRDDANKKIQNLLKFIPSIGKLKKLKQMASGKDTIFRGAPHMIVVSADTNAPCKDVDPIIALSYFDLFAQTLDVGTLWCGYAYYLMKMFPSIAKRMNIPKNYKISYVMLFGAPSIKYARSSQPDDVSVSKIN